MTIANNTTMTSVSVGEEDDDNSNKQYNNNIITAKFSSFEDFVSRIILVPQNDDLCTGAKVGGGQSTSSSSHDNHDTTVVIIDNTLLEHVKAEQLETEGGQKLISNELLCTVATNNCCEKNVSFDINDELNVNKHVDENKQVGITAKKNNLDCGATATTDEGSYIGTIVAEHQQQHQMEEEVVPMGYILIKIIITSNDNNNNNNSSNNDVDAVDIPNDLASIEFTELFSFLRFATFPLSLVFAPPPPLVENSIDDNDNDEEDDDCNNNDNAVNVKVDEEKQFSSSITSTKTISSKIINEISAVSREDASKYAKQAATELRGRLSRWGYQAASIAVDAATQVKEMRDDNSKQQRMMSAEDDDDDDDDEPQQQNLLHQHRSSNLDDKSGLTTTYNSPHVKCALSEEKKEDGVCCFETGEKIDDTKIATTKTEDMINNGVNRKALPLDNHSPQEAKIAELTRLLQLKDVSITRLQQESIESNATKVKMMAELQSCRDAERNLMSALKISESTVIEQERAKASLVAGQERTVKALLNEKAIQQAAIDARDGKIDTLSNQLSELTKRTSHQSEQLGSIESLKNELIQAQRRCSSAEAVIVKMKEKESELSMDLAKAISKSAELEMEIEKKDASHKKSIADESENRRLKIERNSLRQRVEGLSKEVSKTNSKSLESEKMKMMIQELRSENRNLLEQIEVIKTEKRDILAKLEATCAAHEQSVRYQRSSSTPTKADNSSCVLEDRVSELESVIASMTDYLSAKDQQISTLKQINEAILKDNR